MASVGLRRLAKSYGALQIVKGIDLEIRDREFIVLVGPSGCGKSTTLRMIAGLERISSGEIRIGDRVVSNLPPRERNIAMVFQDYALYPHKSVYDNMAFSLKVRRIPAPEIKSRISEAAEMLDILHLLDRMPRQLSGGQRQRVAMGRAIVRRPEVFLFDEPLSNLDAKLRVQVRTEIKRLHQTIGTTIIYVTHDQVEAMTLADRIVVMNGGEIEQVGTPDEVYKSPASMFVGGFIGAPAMNFVKATVRGPDLIIDGGGRVGLSAHPVGKLTALDGREVVVGLRPEHLAIGDSGGGDSACGLAGRVQVVEPLGSDTLVHFAIGGGTLTARLAPDIRPSIGDVIHLAVDPTCIRLFDVSTKAALH
jgi:multiple sugar transport system ATP-binding protein